MALLSSECEYNYCHKYGPILFFLIFRDDIAVDVSPITTETFLGDAGF